MSKRIADIRTMVNTMVTPSTVEERLVNTLAQDEINKRAEKIIGGLNRIRTAEGEIKKMTPDVITVDDTGAETKAYSKERWNKRQEAEKKLAALVKSVDMAIGGDFSKLK